RPGGGPGDGTAPPRRGRATAAGDSPGSPAPPQTREERAMSKQTRVPGSAGSPRRLSRRTFLGVTAGTTVALSLGTFIRSGLGAPRVNVLTWSNTLHVMDDVLREEAPQATTA